MWKHLHLPATSCLNDKRLNRFLFERLKKLRLEIAREESMPPYIIFSDKTLIDMAAKMPASKPEMLDVSGVGENKFAKYGERFLEVIEEYRRE